MVENRTQSLVGGSIVIAAFLLAPLASGAGLTTHQNHGKTYYYHGKQLPHQYNHSQSGVWDRGSGYRVPHRDQGYHYDEGSSQGYYQPPHTYHGRTYYPHDSRAQHENTLHDGYDYHQEYDRGYDDGYHDAPRPDSGGTIYLYKGIQH